MIWRNIPGYPDYELSDTGLIRRVTPYGHPKGRGYVIGKAYKGRVYPGGVPYLTHGLKAPGGRTKRQYVHRLLLLTFVGPPPSPKHECCHNDGNSLNIALNNLRWDIHKGNVHDSIKHRTFKPPPGISMGGESHPNSKLTAKQVAAIRKEYAKGGISQNALGRKYGIDGSTVSLLVNGKRWKGSNKWQAIKGTVIY
jgi:hypothetical protein